jgi:hypothetical protein
MGETMSNWEIAVICTSAALALLKFYLQYIHRDKTKPFQAEGTLDTIMLALVVSVLLPIRTTTIPKLEDQMARVELKTFAIPAMQDQMGRMETKIAPIPAMRQGLEALIAMTEQDPLHELVRHVTTASRRLQGIEDDSIKRIFTGQFEWTLKHYREHLVSIQNNNVKIAREQVISFSDAVLENARLSIEATSYVDPAMWWLTPEGTQYLNHNSDAVRRGVKIQRIFIYRSDKEFEALRPIIAAQKTAGIDVYLCDWSRLPKSLYKDVIIMDQKLVGELGVSSDNRDFNTVLVSIAPADVQRVRRDWTDLMRTAKPAE